MPPASPLRSRDAGRVVSKSDTKDASRSSGLQRNRGIMRFCFARFTLAEPFVSDLDIGPALEDCLATARRCFPMHTPTKPGSDIRHLSRGWRVRPQAPSCAVRPGTFRAAGCGLLRAGAFDDVRDRNPVPRRVRCPRPEGNVPGRAGCPRWRPGAGPRCVQAQARDVSSSGLRAPRFRLGRAARPGQLAHAGSPRRAAGPAPGRCSPHAWPQHRRRPPVVRRSARSTAPAP